MSEHTINVIIPLLLLIVVMLAVRHECDRLDKENEKLKERILDLTKWIDENKDGIK
jgi:hypothetical protein